MCSGLRCVALEGWVYLMDLSGGHSWPPFFVFTPARNMAASRDIERYSSEAIQVLKGLDPVRKRPGMFIGSTGVRGLHHLVYEVVDNAIDEAMAGFCDKIEVFIHEDDAITVSDNGRGIPVDIHKAERKPGVEVAMTMLHAGGKFDKNTYKVSGGLHGVGVSVVNALSERLDVWIRRDGKEHHMAFERGATLQKLEVTAQTKKSGTTVKFKPDPKIFDELRYDYATLSNRLRELAFLNSGVTLVITDERGEHFFQIQVRTNRNHLGTEQNPLPIIPGMVATVDIMTGQKTVMDYILKPLKRAQAAALSER